MTTKTKRRPRSRSLAQENAECMFHYVVTKAEQVHWFPTEADAEAWIKTHRTEGGKYVLAHFRSDALRRHREAA